MSRTKFFALNSSFTLLNNIIVLIVGLITPRLMLVYFGSSINGLLASINQFISYFSLVEAGLAHASIVALYKPLANNDIDEVSGIVSATKKYYYQTGYLFVALIAILSIMYPALVEASVLSNLEIGLLIIFIGANGFLNFFSLAKYSALLTATQRVYMISIASSVYTILHTAIIILGVYLNYSLLSIYFVSIIAMLSRNIILHLYVKKNFPLIDFNAKPNYSSLHQRWDALILQFVGLAQNAAPTLIITFFASLKEVSVFAIYNLVASGIQNVLGIFTNSSASAFGDLIAREDNSLLKKVYNEFELIYLMIIAIIYMATFNLILPFVNLYTQGVEDINYNLPVFGFLVALNSFLYIIKTPQGMLINSAGHFKETKVQAMIQALIIIIGGIVLIIPLGVNGILIAMALSNLYRFIDLFIYVPKNIIKAGYGSSFKNYSLLVMIMLVSQLIIVLFPFNVITGFVAWGINGMIIVVITSIVLVTFNLVINREEFINVIKRVSSIGLMNKK